MKVALLALSLLWAPAAWALPTPDPLAAACMARGGVWWAFDVGGACLMPRHTLTPRETITPRETFTPRLELPGPVVLPVAGGGGSVPPPPLQPTPEPATLLLFGTTAAGLGVARWIKRRRSG